MIKKKAKHTLEFCRAQSYIPFVSVIKEMVFPFSNCWCWECSSLSFICSHSGRPISLDEFLCLNKDERYKTKISLNGLLLFCFSTNFALFLFEWIFRSDEKGLWRKQKIYTFLPGA